MRLCLLAVPVAVPVLLAVEVYRRGWLSPLAYGAALWMDAAFGYRPAWTGDPE